MYKKDELGEQFGYSPLGGVVNRAVCFMIHNYKQLSLNR